MITAIVILSLIGTLLGLLLSGINQLLPFKADPLVESITEILPGTQCGQCGFAGCSQAAVAVINGEAPLTLCPPGGPGMARQLADALQRPLQSATHTGPLLPSFAKVISDRCIGCTKCLQACPTDAIVGAPKQLHMVFETACNGCTACVDSCPTEAIVVQETPLTLSNWRWAKPIRTIELTPVADGRETYA